MCRTFIWLTIGVLIESAVFQPRSFMFVHLHVLYPFMEILQRGHAPWVYANDLLILCAPATDWQPVHLHLAVAGIGCSNPWPWQEYSRLGKWMDGWITQTSRATSKHTFPLGCWCYLQELSLRRTNDLPLWVKVHWNGCKQTIFRSSESFM